MIELLDAHLHQTHAPNANYPSSWSYFSCAAGPDDWSKLSEISSGTITPFLGIHPETPKEERTNENIKLLEKHLIENPAAGIGEIGLDRRFYQDFPKKDQEDLFIAQVKLAERFKRPVTLHQVRAIGSLAELLEDLRPTVPLLLHGWKGDIQSVRRLIKTGCYISLGPGKQWEDPRFCDMVKDLPTERIMLESDWPYCSKRQAEPLLLPTDTYSRIMINLYSTAAEVLGIDINEIIAIVRTNGKIFTN